MEGPGTLEKAFFAVTVTAVPAAAQTAAKMAPYRSAREIRGFSLVSLYFFTVSARYEPAAVAAQP